MTLPIYPIELVVPHRPPMIWIDEVVARRSDGIVTTATIRPTDLLFQAGRGMPAHVAIEWMAQTCAAFAGSKALDEEAPVKIGFLLGTRDFRATRSWLAEGTRFYVSANLEYLDAEMANFACQVAEALEGPVVATASVNVFHPKDAEALINSQAGTIA